MSIFFKYNKNFFYKILSTLLYQLYIILIYKYFQMNKDNKKVKQCVLIGESIISDYQNSNVSYSIKIGFHKNSIYISYWFYINMACIKSNLISFSFLLNKQKISIIILLKNLKKLKI